MFFCIGQLPLRLIYLVMYKKMKKLFMNVSIIWLKLLISGIALSAIGLRIAYPTIKIDAISIGLIIIAFLPWFSELIESAEFPGGWKIKFRDTPPISKKSDPEIPESIEKSDEEENFHRIVAAALNTIILIDLI